MSTNSWPYFEVTGVTSNLSFITIVTMAVAECYSWSPIGSSNSKFIAFHKHEPSSPFDGVMTTGDRGLSLCHVIYI